MTNSIFSKFLVCFSILLCFDQLYAQTPADALRFSWQKVGGTARGAGVAGAFGALGGDFSSLSINPAGIGFYRTSEATISPGLHINNSSSEYFGNTEKDSRSIFYLQELGVVIAGSNSRRPVTKNTSNWKAINYGFGINRLNDYNARTSFSGINPSSSITDYFASQANGTPSDLLTDNFPFGAGLAWEGYMIDPDNNIPDYYVGVFGGGGILQEQTRIEKNGSTEYLFSAGTNYRDQIYFGATLSVPFINYNSETTYREVDVNNVHPTANDLYLIDVSETTGVGVNGKFGVIYRTKPGLRVGIAVQTPTRYNLTDNYVSSAGTTLEGIDGSFDTNSPEGTFEYFVRSPWKTTTSLAYIIKKSGFISLDYSYSNFGKVKFIFQDDNNSAEFENFLNGVLSDSFQANHELRLGGEWAKDKLRFRAGLSYSSSPYTDNSNLFRQTVNAGFGYRWPKIFLDFAYVYSRNKLTYQPYSFTNFEVEAADITYTAGQAILTLGFKFNK